VKKTYTPTSVFINFRLDYYSNQFQGRYFSEQNASQASFRLPSICWVQFRRNCSVQQCQDNMWHMEGNHDESNYRTTSAEIFLVCCALTLVIKYITWQAEKRLVH